jgi:hypothetical protein
LLAGLLHAANLGDAGMLTTTAAHSGPFPLRLALGGGHTASSPVGGRDTDEEAGGEEGADGAATLYGAAALEGGGQGALSVDKPPGALYPQPLGLVGSSRRGKAMVEWLAGRGRFCDGLWMAVCELHVVLQSMKLRYCAPSAHLPQA